MSDLPILNAARRYTTIASEHGIMTAYRLYKYRRATHAAKRAKRRTRRIQEQQGSERND